MSGKAKTHCVDLRDGCLLKVHANRWLLKLVEGLTRICCLPLCFLVLFPWKIYFSLQTLPWVQSLAPEYQSLPECICHTPDIGHVLVRWKLQIHQCLCLIHILYSGFLISSLLFYFSWAGRKEGRWFNPSILLIKFILCEESNCVCVCVFTFTLVLANPNRELYI